MAISQDSRTLVAELNDIFTAFDRIVENFGCERIRTIDDAYLAVARVQKYVYDLFGPGVNLAARMKALSEPMKITLCDDTYELIKDDLVFTERREFDIKGFGRRFLHFVEGERH
jgi:adenylate cyclase